MKTEQEISQQIRMRVLRVKQCEKEGDRAAWAREWCYIQSLRWCLGLVQDDNFDLSSLKPAKDE